MDKGGGFSAITEETEGLKAQALGMVDSRNTGE